MRYFSQNHNLSQIKDVPLLCGRNIKYFLPDCFGHKRHCLASEVCQNLWIGKFSDEVKKFRRLLRGVVRHLVGVGVGERDEEKVIGTAIGIVTQPVNQVLPNAIAIKLFGFNKFEPFRQFS